MGYIFKIKNKWEQLDEAWRVAIIAFLVARCFYAIWSWVVLTVQPVAVHYLDLHGKPGVIFLSLSTSRYYSYIGEVNGEKLTFRASGKDYVTDFQTRSTWHIETGAAVNGPLKGVALAPTAIPSYIFAYHNMEPYSIAWLALWQRYDVIWYTSIAENGYGAIEGDDHFPPIYPMLIRLLRPIFGNAFIAGLIISHAATLYTLKLLVEAHRQWNIAPAGKNVLLYFLLYPASFYLFSAYTESTFLMFVLLAMLSMKKGAWTWAGFWIFCAINTRLQGAALLAPMLYLMRNDRPFLRKFQQWAGLAIAGGGLLFYLFLRSTLVPSTSVPFHEPAWHARLVLPWETYLYAIQALLSENFQYIDFLNWFIMTLFIVLLIIGWQKLPLEFNLYTVFNLLIILTRIVEAQPLISMSRYALTLFPGFFVISFADENPWLRRVIIYTSLALNLYLSAGFFVWNFVA